MVQFKIVIGDPETVKSYQKEVSDADAEKLLGKKLGDEFHGELIGLAGYELKITGGSDSAGFPMLWSAQGPARFKVLVTKGFGFKASTRDGQRKRRTVRGNTISTETAQINCKVVKAGTDSVAKLLGLETAAKTEEKLADAKE